MKSALCCLLQLGQTMFKLQYLFMCRRISDLGITNYDHTHLFHKVDCFPLRLCLQWRHNSQRYVFIKLTLQ